MAGETNLQTLIRHMQAALNEGEYVFVSVAEAGDIDRSRVICEFREQEGTTLIMERGLADELKLTYDFVAAWITLKVHSSLEAVGLTAAFSNALAQNHISCNVVAGYYHDHIFVDSQDRHRTIEILQQLSGK
ncbi:MAG: ACT domain-containing protein [Bacteroidota bacterium]